MGVRMKSGPAGRKIRTASGRKPGAPPGNLNALKHGFYARHLSGNEAQALGEAAAETLNGEIALTRVAARRMLELLQAEGTTERQIALANVISTAAVRVASLLKTKKYLSTYGDGLGAALEEALKSLAAEAELATARNGAD